jgi:hypothetical protein
MPYFVNEANGRVVNISDAKNPTNGDRMAEEAMNTPTRSYKDAEGNWRSRGFRPATPAEIKAHQQQEREDAERRAQVIEARRQAQAKNVTNISTVDPQALISAMKADGEGKGTKAKTNA